MRQYKFADLFGKFPKGDYFKQLDAFCMALGISRSHAYKYMRATWDEPANMPISRLLKAAEFFGVTVDEIINHPTTIPV